jgi:serine/threonine-protein kinase RsbW
MNTAHSNISLPATLDNMAAAVAFAESRAGEAGVVAAKLPGLCLAVEEAFINICTHGFPDGQGRVELGWFTGSGSFVLEIADSGPEFDLLSVPEPDLSTEIEDREIGGLGVHFIRKFTDQADWRRENGKNILRLTVHLGQRRSHPQTAQSHD